MIESMRLVNAPCFERGGVGIGSLKQFNFFFGANGSGKTTIGQALAAPLRFPGTTLTWERSGEPLSIRTYNLEYVRDVFGTAADLPGVFLLGKASREVHDEIATLQVELKVSATQRESLATTLGDYVAGTGALGEISTLRTELTEAGWLKRDQVPEALSIMFAGYRGNKARFLQQVLDVASENDDAYEEFDLLREEAATVLDLSSTRLDALTHLNMDISTGADGFGLFAVPVVGSKDVALAPLINKLDNSDWVRQGRPFLPTASPRCPFCQQSVSHELTVQLSEYFDARYTDQLDELSRFGAKHDAMARRAREYIDKIKPLLLAQVDNDALELSLARLDKVLLQNERAIKNKLDQPSNIVKLEDLQAEMASVNALIDEANERTRSHNALVDNRAEAHQNLIRRCWRTFVRGVLVADITYYEARIGGLEAARESLQGKLHKKKDQEVADRDRLQKLQTQITSSQPIITKINGLLRSVGFLSFHLAESRAATDGYELVRADGTHASGTLSEGERTFITFLYFYHQLQGVQTDTSESPTLVAVIDDPISSLDSDILFVVSTLIRRLMGQIRKEERRVRQLILLTHNVHFQKEVTYIRSGEPSSGRHFFVVRKRAGQPSEVIPYLGKNPVRTVYKSLWDEVARAKSSPDESSVGLQNVMRRILENYFRVLGGIDDSVIISQFEGEQQIICRSLFSWINEGSHSIIEESEFSPSGMSIDAYLEVFEQIFTRSDNRGHYTMMMGVELEVPDGAIPIEVGQ